MEIDKVVREHILYLLRGGGAHLSFEDALNDFPAPLIGEKVKGSPHTAWQLLEHMRIAQRDILEFSRNPDHTSPKFPEGYWPETEFPPDEAAWNASVKSFKKDLHALQKIVEDESIALCVRIPHGEGQTILREALLVADHNAYHLGQFVLIRKILDQSKLP